MRNRTDLTVLLGEAPKSANRFAFDADSFTTQQIAGALNVDPRYLHKRFWVMNVFEAPQLPGGRGFDEFPAEDAVREIRRIDFPNLQIVCVGTRVASAMAAALEISALPENRFGTFYPPKRGGEWLLGYITHPSGRRWTQPDDQGSYLTRETQQFLRKASQARG